METDTKSRGTHARNGGGPSGLSVPLWCFMQIRKEDALFLKHFTSLSYSIVIINRQIHNVNKESYLH